MKTRMWSGVMTHGNKKIMICVAKSQPLELSGSEKTSPLTASFGAR